MADESGQIGVMLICGIPAAGKSTFAKILHKYVQEITDGSFHTIYVCYDDLIPFDLDLYGSSTENPAQNGLEMETENRVGNSETLENFENYSLWKQHRKYILEAVEKIMNLLQNSPCGKGDEGSGLNLEAVELKMEGLYGFQEFWGIFLRSISKKDRKCSCIESGSSSWRWNGSAHVILVDDNMFYHSMRYEYVQLARKCKLTVHIGGSFKPTPKEDRAGFAEVFLKCPLEIAEERNNLRSHPVSSDTMKNMFSKMEPPEPDKFPWEQFSVTFKSEVQWDIEIMESVTLLIREALKHPAVQCVEDFEEKEKSRMACITSIVHQTDQVVRKYVSKVISEAKGSGKGKKELQFLAAQLNKQKKAFLDNLHSIKSYSECSGKEKRSLASKQHLPGDKTEITRDNSRERTLDTVCKQSVTSDEKQIALVQGSTPHFQNIVAGQSRIGDSRSHFCLCCFPDVEDKEEFKSYVEELFNEIIQS